MAVFSRYARWLLLRTPLITRVVKRVMSSLARGRAKAEVLFDDPMFVAAGADSEWARRRRVTLPDLMNGLWSLTAFLGGDFRYWTEGSVYGVHRFFWEAHSANDAALAQIVSAALVEYIRSMGVDTKIFALASQAGSSEVITPSHEVLLALNVVNDGRKPPKWTIESVPHGLYLKGEQETDNGINKFMLVCSPRESTMPLYAIFDGGNNAERDIRWPVNWLFLDHSPIRLDKQLISKDIKNGMINLVYRVDSNLIAAISRAKFVGVGLQPTAEAQVFLGFDSMPFREGAIKMPGLISVCAHGGN